MTHEPRRDELLDLALGLLEPDQARALEAHAAGCAACRAELAALRQTRQLLAGLPPAEAPARGAAVLLAAARHEAARAEAARRPRWAAPAWLWGGTLGLASAAALAVLVLRAPVPPTGPGRDDAEALLGRGAPAPIAAPVPAAAPAIAQTPARTPAGAAVPARDAFAESTADLAREPQAEAPRRAESPRRARAPAAPAPTAPPTRPNAAPAALAEPSAAPPRPSAPARSEEAIGIQAAKGEAEGPAAAVAPSPPLAKAMRNQPAAEARAAPAAARAGADVGGTTCRLEASRHVTRDAAGRVVGRVREGRYPADGGEVPLRVEERFGPDGRLLGALVRAGARLVTVSAADVEARRLEPLPGVVLAGTADEAERAPPRCEP